MSLTFISQQIAIYGGIFIFVIGVVGNGINVFIFTTIRNYRRTPCIFYFLIASIFNILFIVINLTTRILSVGFGNDLAKTSIIWCKARQFFVSTLPLVSLTCSCCATIDQYLLTSKNINLHRFSNIKWTHRSVIIIIILCLLYGILPSIYYYIPRSVGTCTYTDYAYKIIHIMYVMGWLTTVPTFIMCVFGYLTYRNIHQTRVLAAQQADRQSIRMILIIVLTNLIWMGSYGINILYGFLTAGNTKQPNQIAIENFVSSITAIFAYIYFAV